MAGVGGEGLGFRVWGGGGARVVVVLTGASGHYTVPQKSVRQRRGRK